MHRHMGSHLYLRTCLPTLPIIVNELVTSDIIIFFRNNVFLWLELKNSVGVTVLLNLCPAGSITLAINAFTVPSCDTVTVASAFLVS